MIGLGSFNQSLRQPETCAQQALAACHLASVRFVVVARKVQQAMKNQHFELDGKRVALFDALAVRRRHADGKISCDFLPLSDQRIGRKRKDVRRLVFAAILAIEPADYAVRRKQHAHLAAQANGGLRLCQEPTKGAGGGNSSVGSGVKIQVWVEEDHRAQGQRLMGSPSLTLILREGPIYCGFAACIACPSARSSIGCPAGSIASFIESGSSCWRGWADS
jgi:hypothetical protein